MAAGVRAVIGPNKLLKTFTDLVIARPTPIPKMMPGIFSWANTIPLGRNWRNPNAAGLATHLAWIKPRARSAAMERQPPWQSRSHPSSPAGNTAPMQLA
jgi:hypothetical protein